MNHVFVSKSFRSDGHPHKTIPALQNQSDTDVSYHVDNQVIFALGLALIEISFGVPILKLKESRDQAIEGLTEFMIASRLLQQGIIRNRESDIYADVVLRCIKCQLSILRSPLNLEEVKVQQCFYGEIVLPLQNLHNELHKP